MSGEPELQQHTASCSCCWMTRTRLNRPVIVPSSAHAILPQLLFALLLILLMGGGGQEGGAGIRSTLGEVTGEKQWREVYLPE